MMGGEGGEWVATEGEPKSQISVNCSQLSTNYTNSLQLLWSGVAGNYPTDCPSANPTTTGASLHYRLCFLLQPAIPPGLIVARHSL